MSGWEWISTGGDSLCDDMAGLHFGEEPVRPHPNCVCSVHEYDTETHYASMYNYGLDELSYESNGPGTFDYTMKFNYAYQIFCSDGSGHSGEFTLERDYETWSQEEGENFENTEAMLDEVDDEAADNIEQLIDIFCPAPPPPLVG